MSKRLLVVLFVTSCFCREASSNSCRGTGTAVFYGNGMFNTYEDAKEGLRGLENSINSSVKKVKFRVAYQDNGPILRQLLQVYRQKNIEETMSFWLWLGGLQTAPEWFHVNETLKSKTEQDINFDFLHEQLRDYLSEIRRGNKIILVSHSQGNLYANQVLRRIDSFVDEVNYDSLEEVRRKYGTYPRVSEFIGNVQVATPVGETLNGSPWFTFGDDFIINLVRKLVGALPPTLESKGTLAGDRFGHSLLGVYLANSESREKIVKAVLNFQEKLIFPIPWKKALAIRYRNGVPTLDDGEIYFESELEHGLRTVKRLGKDLIDEFYVSCISVPPGKYSVRATAMNNDFPGKNVTFSFVEVLVGENGEDLSKKHSFSAKKTSQWKIADIEVKKGGQDPISFESVIRVLSQG